jgi:FkbM family methyltransferase
MNLIIKNLIKRIFGLEFFECLKRWKDYRHNYKTGNFGRYGIDKILEEKLPHKDGFYVELGANNGAKESNSYYFELNKGWRGILIEPTPNLYLSCVKRRGSNNAVFCNACVPFNYNEEFVHMRYSDSMTISDNLNLDIGDHKKHIETGSQFLNEGETTFSFGAKSATLNSLLEKAKAPALIDFLSLDVEGAELDVLKGVDFSKYNFKYMVIECRDINKMCTYLNELNYSLEKKITHHDYLFKYTKN